MKILNLVEYFYPYSHGGTEQSVYYLMKEMTSYGYEEFLLTPNYGTVKQEKFEGIHIVRFPFPKKIDKNHPKTITPLWHHNPFIFVLSLLYICMLVITYKIDIIHVHSKSMIPQAVIAQWIFGIRAIVTLRDYFVICPYGLCITRRRGYRGCTLRILLNTELTYYAREYSHTHTVTLFHYMTAIYSRIVSVIQRFFLRRAYAIVCISQKMQKIYAINGIKNTQVIYNSMRFQKHVHPKKPQLVILYVGRITPGKGAELFVNAAKEILKSYPKLQFKLIGDGFLRDSLYSNLSSQQRLVLYFLGHTDYHQTLELIEQSLLVVVPSKWEEPFGRVALEALSLGVPVVVTDRGGLPEIVAPKVTGYVVNAETGSLVEGIKTAIKNNVKLRKNIQHVYPDLVSFFYKKPIQQYKQLYAENS